MTYEKYDYGPLLTYEVVWKTGHIETVVGHQVTFRGGEEMFGQSSTPRRFYIHGMFPGERWRLLLSGLEDDVLTIREVTVPEQIGGES